MGISANDQITASYDSLLREETMLDPHSSNFKIIGELLLMGKIPNLFCLLGTF